MELESRANVKAPSGKVWQAVLDKFRFPEKFIPGVIENDIKPRDVNEYVRRMFTEDDEVVELVTIYPDEMTMTFSLVKHALLKGTLSNQVVADGENTILIFKQDREPTIEGLEDLDMQPALDEAVLQLKEYAEKLTE